MWWLRNQPVLYALIAGLFPPAALLTTKYLTRLARRNRRDINLPSFFINRNKLEVSLRTQGPVAYKESRKLGRTHRESVDMMSARLLGAAQRNVYDIGRDMVDEAINDRSNQILAYRRITDGDPCAFCAMLASRGAVYVSKQTAEFKAHDNCGCTAEPAYEIGEEPDATQVYEKAWIEATRGYSGKDAIRAFRRYWESRPGGGSST